MELTKRELEVIEDAFIGYEDKWGGEGDYPRRVVRSIAKKFKFKDMKPI